MALDQDNAAAITWLLDHCQPQLSVWELDFLDNIRDLTGLSPRQQAKLDDIWREVVVERKRR